MSANADLGDYYFGWYDPDEITCNAVYENYRGEAVPVTAVFEHSVRVLKGTNVVCHGRVRVRSTAATPVRSDASMYGTSRLAQLWGPSMWQMLHDNATNTDIMMSFQEFSSATPDERRHCTKLIVDTEASSLPDDQLLWKDAVSLIFVQFRKCPNLIQIPSALANCPRLERVNLCKCPRLKDLPTGLGREPIEVSDAYLKTTRYIRHILKSGQLGKRWRAYLVTLLDDEERLLPDLAKLVVSYL